MPPQVNPAADAPFLTDTLLSTLICDDVGLMRMPDMQLVVVVTFWTQPRVVPMNRMPSAMNRCTTPGPRMPTFLCAFVLMPMSVDVGVPLHAVSGSACPVMVTPLRASTMFGAPNRSEERRVGKGRVG